MKNALGLTQSKNKKRNEPGRRWHRVAQFAPQDRIEVNETYIWPLVEGFSNLVRVRRRQDAGVDEIARLYPHLIQHEDKKDADMKSLFLRDPISFLSYCSVKLAVRLGKQDSKWTRGR